MKKQIYIFIKSLVTISIIITVFILGDILYSSLQNIYCARDTVRDIYLRDIKDLETYLEEKGEFPQDYSSEYSFCVEYSRDDLPQQAFLWLSIGQTSTLGYKMPQGVYLGFEPDMKDDICKEMRRLKDSAMKDHFFQNNDFCLSGKK